MCMVLSISISTRERQESHWSYSTEDPNYELDPWACVETEGKPVQPTKENPGGLISYIVSELFLQKCNRDTMLFF